MDFKFGVVKPSPPLSDGQPGRAGAGGQQPAAGRPRRQRGQRAGGGRQQSDARTGKGPPTWDARSNLHLLLGSNPLLFSLRMSHVNGPTAEERRAAQVGHRHQRRPLRL